VSSICVSELIFPCCASLDDLSIEIGLVYGGACSIICESVVGMLMIGASSFLGGAWGVCCLLRISISGWDAGCGVVGNVFG